MIDGWRGRAGMVLNREMLHDRPFGSFCARAYGEVEL